MSTKRLTKDEASRVTVNFAKLPSWSWSEPGGKLTLPLGSHLRYNLNMRKPIKVKPKKRGRPATGKHPLYGVRIPDALFLAVDRWAKENDCASRSEAIRRLIAQALANDAAKRPPSKETAHKASNLAAREIEPLGDKSLPMDEQQRRKRRLTHGPKEFRDLRKDLSKAKK